MKLVSFLSFAFGGLAAAQTNVVIGQNYLDEWNGFTNKAQLPAGISLYGNIFDGTLNADSQELLEAYAAENSGFVEIGLSWKDDMTSHGYTQYQGAQLCNDIATGKFDDSLQTLAEYLGQYPNVSYLLRPDYEVSGNLHANTVEGAFDPSTFDTTAYPSAFSHIREVLTQTVTNIEFMYHSVRGGAELLYPGDDAVDWIGFSIFNNDVCLPVGTTTNCEGSRVDPNVMADIEFASAKPKWIAESGAQPPASDDPDSFIDYLTRVTELVETNDFQGWTYINSGWVADGWDPSVWSESRIEVNEPVLAWFEENVISNPRYVFG